MDEERYMEAGRQENVPPRSRREAPRRGGGWMGKAALVISVLALAVSAAALSLTLLGRGEEAGPAGGAGDLSLSGSAADGFGGRAGERV